MPIETIIAYITTVLILLITPGPSHLLMISNSAVNGLNRAWTTAIGDLSANTLQIIAAGAGLAAALLASQHLFEIVKWAGVAYLIWKGLQLILKASSKSPEDSQKANLKALFLQGFLTSAANPKAVVFFAALFPQFIDPALPLWPQIAILGAIYIAIDGAFLLFYGFTADRVARRLVGSFKIWLDRISGSFLIVSAILLGLKSVQGSR